MEQLDRFTEELHEWSLNGKEPSLASRDLRYFLDLQERRLKKGNIAREEYFTHVKEEIRGTSHRKENGYSSKILYREAMQEIAFHKDGKQIRKIRRPVNLYVTFVDKEGHEDREYICPNCGNKKPAPAEGWTCSCGTVNQGNFCMNCGNKKPVSDEWTCSCGAVNKGNFCMNCGNKKA